MSTGNVIMTGFVAIQPFKRSSSTTFTGFGHQLHFARLDWNAHISDTDISSCIRSGHILHAAAFKQVLPKFPRNIWMTSVA